MARASEFNNSRNFYSLDMTDPSAVSWMAELRPSRAWSVEPGWRRAVWSIRRSRFAATGYRWFASRFPVKPAARCYHRAERPDVSMQIEDCEGRFRGRCPPVLDMRRPDRAWPSRKVLALVIDGRWCYAPLDARRPLVRSRWRSPIRPQAVRGLLDGVEWRHRAVLRRDEQRPAKRRRPPDHERSPNALSLDR